MAYKAGSLVVDILANDQVTPTLDKLGNKINGFGKKSSRSSRNGGGFGFLSIAKWTAVFAVARRFGRVLGNIVQAGADYTETLNLWETAMGDNLNMATEFVNKMNEAYGISEKTLMNAQAIFKNMLGSLGEISDTMAYSLSEGVTQMAIDYASLYNVTFESAFQKFQAALAGQVRPIRSVAGYDITENTLYQLYQTLGGTKSMRQLTRTEKQLLAIYAVFQQMERSGAVGDLDKTMESFANQSRVMAEAWQQVKTYAGTLLAYTLQQSGVLTYINAILMFIGDALKVLAEDMNAIEHYGGNIFENTTDSALDASDAIDEVQGKLLDFDKFRSLSGSEENALGLDETLLKALSGYNSILENASTEARRLANEWLNIIGITRDENGVLTATDGALKKIKNTLTAIAVIVGGLFALTIIATIVKLGTTIYTYAIQPLIKLASVMVSLVKKAIVAFVNALKNSQPTLLSTTKAITGLQKATLALSAAFFIGGLSALLSSEMSAGEKLTKVFIGLAAGITAAAIAIAAFKQNWVQALTIGATVAGGFYTVSALTYDNYANGGLPDKGTLFRAGEAGAEIVYNTPSGQSGVANVQQIEQAMYGALIRYGKTQGANGQPIEVYLDGEKVYQNTTAHAKRRGNVWGRA